MTVVRARALALTLTVRYPFQKSGYALTRDLRGPGAR